MLINKEEVPQVAMEFMNDVHAEDVEIINDLYDLILAYEDEQNSINEEAINKKYQHWFEHTIEHFGREEKKMLELRFPPYPRHKGEHENALYKMDNMFRLWQKSKDIKALKYYMNNELPQWLAHHIQTMDTVTARFFQTGMSPCSVH